MSDQNESTDARTFTNGRFVKTVSVQYERKLNLGNYESTLIGVTVWADIDPNGGDAETVVKELQEFTTKHVKEKALPLLQASKDDQNFELRMEVTRQNDVITGLKAEYAHTLTQLITILGDVGILSKGKRDELAQKLIAIGNKIHEVKADFESESKELKYE